MRITPLKINDIKIDENIYPRRGVSKSKVKEYVKDMQGGDKFPPLYIALFKGKYILVDGRHRMEAMQTLGEQYAECEIKTNFPDIESIVLEAIKSNNRHGIRYTKSDKIKQINQLMCMKVDVEDISHLVRISTKEINKIMLPRMRMVRVRSMIKDKRLPTILKEKVAQEEERGDIGVTLPYEMEMQVQIERLEEIKEYLQNVELIDNKKINSLVTQIKRVLKKRFPKL